MHLYNGLKLQYVTTMPEKNVRNYAVFSQRNSQSYRKTRIIIVVIVRQTGQVPPSAATLFAQLSQKRSRLHGRINLVVPLDKLHSFRVCCICQCSCRRCGSWRPCRCRQLRRVVVAVLSTITFWRFVFHTLNAAQSDVSSYLWPPYVIGQTTIFLPCDFFLLLSSSFFSSPNLSGRRLDVYHTSTHGVALVQI